MPLSASSEAHIENVYSTVSVISKKSAFSIVQFCAEHFNDSIFLLCKRMHVSRSGYYKWLNRRLQSSKHSALIRSMRKYQAICKYTAGYRKMHLYLKQHKLTDLSPITIYRLMQKHGLLARSLRTKKSQIIYREIKPYQNLLRRDFSAQSPNQKWCIDITQLSATDKHFYLCAIIDLYDRSIVAYQIANSQDRSLVKKTITEALSKLREGQHAPIILHSDQGYVFGASSHRRFLHSRNITPSMSQSGCPYDNAVIESFFSSLKTECIYLLPEIPAKEMIAEIDHYIVFYNHYRIHMLFGNTPMNMRIYGLTTQSCLASCA